MLYPLNVCNHILKSSQENSGKAKNAKFHQNGQKNATFGTLETEGLADLPIMKQKQNIDKRDLRKEEGKKKKKS